MKRMKVVSWVAAVILVSAVARAEDNASISGKIAFEGDAPKAKRERKGGGGGAHATGATGEVHSPMQGTVLSVAVAVGQEVAAGDVICIVEAMKMENEVTAHTGGTVSAVHVEAGQGVAADELLAVIDGGAE